VVEFCDDMTDENNVEIDLKKVYEFSVRVTYCIYYNDKNYFGIYSFITEDEIPFTKANREGRFEGCLCGNFQKLELGIDYNVKAKLKYNSKYKKYDYIVESISDEQPKTLEEQQKYLELLVTPLQAKNILSVYPNFIEMVMNGEEINIALLKGIGEITLEKIKDKIISNYVIQDILLLLRPLGVTFKMIKTIIKYESNPVLLKQKILENPYLLTAIHGLGFKKVDALALKLNPSLEVSEFRTLAYIKYRLSEIANRDGDTYISLKDMLGYIRSDIYKCEDIYKELIKKQESMREYAIKTYMENGYSISLPTLYVDNEKIGLFKSYITAFKIYNQLMKLDKEESLFEPFTEDEMNQSIAKTEQELGFHFTEEQRSAIKSINERNVIVVTAPAGAGKSSCIKGILNLLKTARVKDSFLERYREQQELESGEQCVRSEMDVRIGQCALSAKAARRIREVSGESASTMHRILGASSTGFFYNSLTPMPYAINVWDEASMVNEELTLSYLNAILPQSKLIIIFDFAQLPPIGSGDFTRDILLSKLHINKFTKVHRQGEKSGILMDANKIRVGINPLKGEDFSSKIVHGELQDMLYFMCSDKKAMQDLAIKAYMSAIKKTGVEDTVIITPRKQNCTNSTLELNKIIQERVLPNENQFIERKTKGKECKFKLGAKVMQKKNNYDKQVFNGDEGYIVEVKNDGIVIEFSLFDEVTKDIKKKCVEHDITELDNIELSYAISVHSSQGSQYHSVICLFDKDSYIMANRRILYTAITRASKRCILIADPTIFSRCLSIDNNKPRNTFLSEIIAQNNISLTD
jgi:exodeoxyribonuclease V alpha subunit